MIEIYRTIEPKNELAKLNKIEKGCWINVVTPTEEEITMLQQQFNILPNFLRDPLDDEEKPRIDVEEDQTLIIVDVPYVYEDAKSSKFETMPLGLLLVQDDYFITICNKEAAVLDRFKERKIKDLYTFKKTRFILQILYQVSKEYLKYLKHIDKKTDILEDSLHRSMKNKELFRLLELEKSLVFFTTSLRSNEIVLEKMLRGRSIKLYEEDQDLLEDVIVENKQAIEMSSIYSSILNGMMDAFASVISNNLNMVMKFLTSVTIVLSIPTIIFSYYGMNVSLPFEHSGLSWLYLLIISLILCIVTIWVLNKRQMF